LIFDLEPLQIKSTTTRLWKRIKIIEINENKETQGDRCWIEMEMKGRFKDTRRRYEGEKSKATLAIGHIPKKENDTRQAQTQKDEL